MLEAKSVATSIDQFHSEIIQTFLPITLREKLKQNCVYRPQTYNESLSMYISEVKIHSEMLRTGLSEREVVCFIKNGIHPDSRNKLVFEQNPTTYQDLDNLCIHNNNVTYNDFVRQSLSVNRNRNSLSLGSNNQSIQNQNTKPNFSKNNSNNKNCYVCKKKKKTRALS